MQFIEIGNKTEKSVMEDQAGICMVKTALNEQVLRICGWATYSTFFLGNLFCSRKDLISPYAIFCPPRDSCCFTDKKCIVECSV